MEEKTIEEVVVDKNESTTTTQEKPVEEKVQVKKKRGRPSLKKQSDDNVIKIDLSKPPVKKEEDAVEEQSTDEVPVRDEPEASKEVLEENKQDTDEKLTEQKEEEKVEEQPVLEEIKEEEEKQVQEKTAELTEEVKEAVEEQKETGVELPENIQKVVEFMEETGGSLEDYVRLNQDYSKLDDNSLLLDYYKQTKPHLSSDEINFLIEDTFLYDEDVDDERDVKRKKLAFKEQVANARSHLDGQKSKYYKEIKAGSKLTPEQQKAMDFFNRYNKESENNTKIAERQKLTFQKKTEDVFSNEFKGFEYNVGDKRYRFNVKDAEKIKDTQSDINNFIGKFLNKDNEMSDAKGYHKSLFTAMNPDAIANHFYQQGKADALKDTVAKSKNIDMNARQGLVNSSQSDGLRFKVLGDNSSKLKFKVKK